MPKTATEIVERALTLVDEQVTTFLDAAETEMSITDMALSILPEVCRRLVKDLPYELKRYLAKDGLAALNAAVDTLANGESQSSYTKKKVAFILPSDFQELVAIRLTVWAKPVTSYILIDSPEYSVQNNPFTRGGKYNPIVAVSNTSSGASARIECFSVASGDATTAAVFQYYSFTNVPNDTDNLWPDELFEKITKALASELHVIKGRIQEGELLGQDTAKAIEQHE